MRSQIWIRGVVSFISYTYAVRVESVSSPHTSIRTHTDMHVYRYRARDGRTRRRFIASPLSPYPRHARRSVPVGVGSIGGWGWIGGRFEIKWNETKERKINARGKPISCAQNARARDSLTYTTVFRRRQMLHNDPTENGRLLFARKADNNNMIRRRSWSPTAGCGNEKK